MILPLQTCPLRYDVSPSESFAAVVWGDVCAHIIYSVLFYFTLRKMIEKVRVLRCQIRGGPLKKAKCYSPIIGSIPAVVALRDVK